MAFAPELDCHRPLRPPPWRAAAEVCGAVSCSGATDAFGAAQLIARRGALLALPAHIRDLPQGSSQIVTQDINVLALVKGNERYIFLFDDSQRAETLRVFGRFASNPELSFSWYDAAVLSQKLRQEAQQSQKPRRFSLPAPLESEGEELF